MIPPSIDQWQALYQQATQVKKMVPWNWMEEIDLFGVQYPADGLLDFVSVMGMAGEHFSIAVYRGAQAVHDLLELHENPSDDPRENGERIMEIPQLQLSFEDRDFLADEGVHLDAFTVSRFEKLMPTARDLAVDFFRLWSPVAGLGPSCAFLLGARCR